MKAIQTFDTHTSDLLTYSASRMFSCDIIFDINVPCARSAKNNAYFRTRFDIQRIPGNLGTLSVKHS